jgi:hypothetical protein
MQYNAVGIFAADFFVNTKKGARDRTSRNGEGLLLRGDIEDLPGKAVVVMYVS